MMTSSAVPQQKAEPPPKAGAPLDVVAKYRYTHKKNTRHGRLTPVKLNDRYMYKSIFFYDMIRS